jgi:hypothetical protein
MNVLIGLLADELKAMIDRNTNEATNLSGKVYATIWLVRGEDLMRLTRCGCDFRHDQDAEEG